MNSPTERTTPPGSPTLAPEPPDPSPSAPPVPLWRVLEDEFRAIHGDALQLDADYKETRDAAIRQAKDELKTAIQQRVGMTAQAWSEELLDAEVEREVLRKPELINGPACKELFQRIHRFVEAAPERSAQHSALAISGGGIRSATFALGVLQGLARQGVLNDIAYLSTVSGGGYIGAWLSSWIERSGKDSGAVFTALGAQEKPAEKPGAQSTTAASSQEPKHPFETEPSPIRHLRKFSNYLTPALGLLSGDGWAVAATVVRNLLLNWMLIVPALLLVLLLPRIALRLELHWLAQYPASGMVAAALSFICGVYALANLLARRGKTQGEVLLHCVAPIVVFSALATVAWFWARTAHPQTGFFPNRTYRVLFYIAWGGLSAALAACSVAVIWRVKKLTLPDGWIVRMATVTAVFALAGFATYWSGERAAVCMAQVEIMQLREQAAAAALAALPKSGAAENPPAPSATWALLSRQKSDSSLSAWVPVEAEKLNDLKHSPTLTLEGPPATDSHQLRVQAAIMSVCFGFPLLITIIFLANTILTGLLSRRMLDEDREWFARASGSTFLLAILFCFLSLLVLRGPDWLITLWDTWPKLLASIGGASALLTIGGGRSGHTNSSDKADEKPDLKTWLLAQAVKCAAPVFVIVLLTLASLLTTLILQKMSGHDVNPREHWQVFELSGLRLIAVAGVVFAALAALSSACVNINKFSLHSMYRNRLIRAYLGATNRLRAPNLFTGFDPDDNMAMARLRKQRPFHVINAALNLVGGSDLAWQQRLAMSFTMTPLTCGSASLGYRDSQSYARGHDHRGITLGTALAISGAAVSPNHGYNSSPLVAFLLTFFNARLGGWFGNPGPAGAKTWTKTSPAFALRPLIDEAFGLTSADHPYVYLSDGGHFENLGLYEMVLRRCRTIIISDAGCDPEYGFEDLGSAISKIRVDFGIRVVFDTHINIHKYAPDCTDAERFRNRQCAYGRICYSDVDGGTPAVRDGVLIYIKASMCGWEPMDVFHYFREHPAFPHEPTTDQWFTESQFESYRALGFHSVEQICRNQPIHGLAEFKQSAAAYVTLPAGA